MNIDIKKTQTALNDRGYGPLKVDGKAGPKTKNAVAAFRKDVGLEPDGLVGSLTKNRLFRDQLSVISLDGDGSTPHFARAEFACDCQGEYCDGFPGAMDLGLMLKLETLRNALDAPVIITSGLRCETRNTEVGGILQSKHRIGQAADLLAPGIAHLLDVTLLGGAGAPLRVAMIGFYLSNEGLSILENLGRLGVPLPKRLAAVIRELGEEETKQKNKR